MLNRGLCCKGVGEARAFKALPQEFDLAQLGSVEQHHVAFHKSVVEKFLSMFAWNIRYKAWPLENLFERRTLAAGHLDGWHGTLTQTGIGH
jgi:hypothetical protein